ncbi:class I SAM-dependent methyltransferase [Actinomadura algeriensis]|uniref:O-methyltransferase YrrM n=1 Tax=Actinomadura algeriensis TaxID=1679523 RepID=A0ABR9JSQ0_9ACTN|nr:class I SAM-dependent methyltransferase [Actinomadura algeriensis]MBE1533403.1 putative O-methyltransferase YrrM [Actinomadura algeriensis]
MTRSESGAGSGTKETGDRDTVPEDAVTEPPEEWAEPTVPEEPEAAAEAPEPEAFAEVAEPAETFAEPETIEVSETTAPAATVVGDAAKTVELVQPPVDEADTEPAKRTSRKADRKNETDDDAAPGIVAAGFAGTRDEPHRQARAAREQPLLLHSMSIFRSVFEAIARAREIETVVEVGVESGRTSAVYADLGATVHCVEPDPTDELRAVLAEDPRLNLVEGRSPDVLGELPVADLYVLDGDHNYAVVRAELAWIMKSAPDAVVAVHDVLWPNGRRDAYRQPSPLAAEDVHPSTAGGPTVWHDEITPVGFVGEGERTVAVHAGGERNGVLTAVEDALTEGGGDWRFEIVPAVFGLGVLARSGSPGAAEIFAALRPYTSSDLLAAMENNRIALYTRVLQLQHEAEARTEDATRMAETIAAQQQEIDRLSGGPGRPAVAAAAPAAAPRREEPAAQQEEKPRSAEVSDYVSTVAVHHDTWGTFLEPDASIAGLENPHEALGIPILSGHHADLKAFAGYNTVFDRIADRVAGVNMAYEDQCSANHYFDVFTRIERDHRQASRIVEVGVFMGGSSTVFAGCVEPMGFELDLVDVNPVYLQFAYERIRRTFPGATPRVRMFYGDLPTYVKKVLVPETATRAIVHHDGAHDFNQVVKDISSLYYVRDRVHSLAIQDTHLRGLIEHFNFVDAAVYAMFGVDVKYEPVGARYEEGSSVTNPNQWNGNYFLAGMSEGMYIPFDGVEWKYPHPSMDLDTFLPVKR